MRRALALALASAAILCTPRARADDARVAAERDEFLAEKRGLMIGLASWSVVSAAAGAVLLATSPSVPKREERVFRQAMGSIFLAYAAINAGLAIGSLAGIEHQRETLRTPTAMSGTRRVSSEVFAVNALMDVVYVTTGGLLWQNASGGLARGTGAGMVIQAGFLVGFDTLGASLYAH